MTSIDEMRDRLSHQEGWPADHERRLTALEKFIGRLSVEAIDGNAVVTLNDDLPSRMELLTKDFCMMSLESGLAVINRSNALDKLRVDLNIAVSHAC